MRSTAFVFLHLVFVLMLAGGAIGGSVVRATAAKSFATTATSLSVTALRQRASKSTP